MSATTGLLTLTVEDIRSISNYIHWIPMTRGYHHDYINEKYPGWNWNELLSALDRAGLIKPHNDGHECERLMQGFCTKPNIYQVVIARMKGGVKVATIIPT